MKSIMSPLKWTLLGGALIFLVIIFVYITYHLNFNKQTPNEKGNQSGVENEKTEYQQSNISIIVNSSNTQNPRVSISPEQLLNKLREEATIDTIVVFETEHLLARVPKEDYRIRDDIVAQERYRIVNEAELMDVREYGGLSIFAVTLDYESAKRLLNIKGINSISESVQAIPNFDI